MYFQETLAHSMSYMYMYNVHVHVHVHLYMYVHVSADLLFPITLVVKVLEHRYILLYSTHFKGALYTLVRA